jgi:hypothetical protein
VIESGEFESEQVGQAGHHNFQNVTDCFLSTFLPFWPFYQVRRTDFNRHRALVSSGKINRSGVLFPIVLPR